MTRNSILDKYQLVFESSITISILYYFVPWFGVILPQIIRYLVILFLILTPIIYDFLRGSIKSHFPICIIPAIISFIYLLGLKTSRLNYISSYASVFLCFNCIYIGMIISNMPKFHSKWIISFLCFVLFASSITTLVGLNIYPSASRELATGNSFRYNLNYYSSLNICGYSFIFAGVLSIPILLFLSKTNARSFSKIHYWCVIVLFFVLTIRTQYSAAVLLFLFAFFISVINNSKKKITSAITFLICVVLFFLFRNSIAKLINALADNISSKYFVISNRLKSISTLIKGNGMEGDVYTRFRLYGQSIETFWRHPIFGIFYDDELGTVGGHSEILDFIATYGLLGVPIIIGIIRYSLNEINKLKESPIYHYIIVEFILMIVLSLFNTSLNAPTFWICFIFPIVARKYRESASDKRTRISLKRRVIFTMGHSKLNVHEKNE